MKASKAVQQLEAARSDLAVIEEKLQNITNSMPRRVETPAAWESYQAEQNAALAERGRLKLLVQQREQEVADEALEDARARAAKQKQENEAVAQRLRLQGTPLVEALQQLLVEVAEVEAKTARLNALLPDAERISGPDAMARSIPMQPREDLSEEVVELWVDAQSGEIVGDQRAVVRRGEASGVLGPWDRRCARRKFRAIDYVEEVAVQRAPSIFSALRLPNLDGPGFAYDGQRVSHPAQALRILAQEPERRPERQKLRQLIPLEPWTPPPEADERTAVGKRFGGKANEQ